MHLTSFVERFGTWELVCKRILSRNKYVEQRPSPRERKVMINEHTAIYERTAINEHPAIYD